MDPNETEGPETTGRYLVLFDEDAGGSALGIEALNNVAGLKAANSADFEESLVVDDKLGGADGVVLERLSVAVVSAPPDQLAALESASLSSSPAILAVEPEQIMYALPEEPTVGYFEDGVFVEEADTGGGGSSEDYLRGYQDGVNALANGMLGDGDGASIAHAPRSRFGRGLLRDTASATWGVQAVAADRSRFTGEGIKVAVLDTGLDLKHPDFVGRSITSASFIQGQAAQDGHGHGTHTIGTACGPGRGTGRRRYGVAIESDIFVGKVLSDQGSGPDQSILSGINWAILNGCEVISMSLGSRVLFGQKHSAIYEMVAQRALAQGSLIIAAAGNDSRRPNSILPVSRPANCPSILAVAAIDARTAVASFSNAGLNPTGGQVDIAGPGVAVFSSWPMPTRYRSINGTSMATPHAAGIAALLAQANPNARGSDLARILVQTARRLSLPSRDVGNGLIRKV